MAKRDWCDVCADTPAGQRWLCPNIANHVEFATPREIQVAREVEVRKGLTQEQIECHDQTIGGHYLTAILADPSGKTYRRCIQCDAILPARYEAPKRGRAVIQDIGGVPTTVIR